MKPDPFLVLKHEKRELENEIRRKDQEIQRWKGMWKNSKITIDHLKKSRLSIARVVAVKDNHYKILNVSGTYDTKSGVVIEVQP